MEQKDLLYKYLLLLGDNSMILAQRLSELCGHGPNLETDIALTNISLDLFGQVRNYFQYAAELKSDGTTEDDVAYKRYERDYYNCILVEQENTDFAYVIVRQFFYDAYHLALLSQLQNSQDTQIAAIATKSIKEAKYHLRFSSEWLKRLGAGTPESIERTQNALNDLYPFVHELFTPTAIEKQMAELGIGAHFNTLSEQAHTSIKETLFQTQLDLPEGTDRFAKGKEGLHTEKLGYILSDFQYMQRAYPNMQW